MTPTARDLVEAGAIDMATYWHNSWETMAPEPKVMYLTASRAALIATFKKLAEDGPTEAMLEAGMEESKMSPEIHERGHRTGRSLSASTGECCEIFKAMSATLLRELEGLTP